MIIEKITVSAAELNAGTDVVKNIAALSVNPPDLGFPNIQKRDYLPIKIRIVNGTGNILYFVPLDDVENAAYVDDATITDKFIVPNNTTFDLDIKKWRITKLVVSGTAGAGHTVDADFYVIKE